MENLTMTITQVSKTFGVTPRMLRHYEKMGLITPTYKEDYAYRTYDENAVRRLQQIVILRKLRLSLKDISVILNDTEYTASLEILRKSIAELNGEISALDVIRNIIRCLADKLEKTPERFDMLEDKEIVELSGTLSLSKNTLKEERSVSTENTVNDLNEANETLIEQLPVRIIMLPPFTVASNHVIGKDPEETVEYELTKFIREKKLYEIKPDSRHFGFNHPNPGILPNDEHGYEMWVTVPEDMEVPAPLTKKHFDGGLFAALNIHFPEFHRWNDLWKWVQDSDKYDFDWRGTEEIMGGSLEEHINWIYNAHNGWDPETELEVTLDLMMPVKKRSD
ncbi:MAG: MerR family transcriptional regulator [Oscillospiraceae bacterium]|jgi:DNA-binding transcriptional MerR regulator|nr:MerR family transcriptional regulator [Oscillospiraceae bacterium]